MEPPNIGPKNPAKAAIPETGPLKITREIAVAMALSNNRSLRVERLGPAIQQTHEQNQAAVFDANISGEIAAEKTDEETQSNASGQTESLVEGYIRLDRYFPSGLSVEGEVYSGQTDDSRYSRDLAQTRLGVSAVMPLMRGRGEDVNLAPLSMARLDTRISAYELRGFCETLVYQVQTAFWDHVLAGRQVEIMRESLDLAIQQQTETKEMIQVGVLAESELAAVDAEAASRKQALINASGELAATRIHLLRLINPPGGHFWDREVTPVHPARMPEAKLEFVEAHAARAVEMRPEMNQARLEAARGDLEIVRTKNGLLPKLDAFITLGGSGYSDSFFTSAGDSPRDGYDVRAGLSLDFPWGNKSARADHRRAVLAHDQALAAIDNLAQVIQEELLKAHIQVDRSGRQIDASGVNRRLQEEKLRVETEKFRVGRSTNLLVARAQRDLLEARISEVEAVVDHIKALTDFWRAEGTLLIRENIAAPGEKPVQYRPGASGQSQAP